MPAEQGEPLSEREIEIVQWVTEGLTNREIAARAFLSPNTVKVHLRNIFAKTGVASRTELTMLAVREGWIAVPGAEAAPPESETYAEETLVAPEPAAAAPITPPWPLHRWLALALGLTLGFVVLWLPSLPTQGNGQLTEGALVDMPLSAAPNAPASETWIEEAPLPLRRARLGLAAYENKLYAVGGLTADGPTDRLDIYDIQTNHWEEGAPRPLALANVAALTLGDRILVPGGCDAQGQPVATVHAYAPATDSWDTLAPLPEPLCAYALARQGNRVYLFGGWDGSQYRAVTYSYDSEKDSWRAGPPPPQARAFGAAATLGEQIYYVGGYDGEEQATCEVYQTAQERWDSCAPMLVRRGGLGLVTLGGQLYAIGGGWNGYLGFNERYRPEANTWSVFETPLVGEWRNLGLTSWETSLYAVGGWSGDYLNRTYMQEVLPFRVFVPITQP